jgi:hypothetical protein
MAKGRKRAPGGGRKPNPNKKVMFSTRLEPEVMAALRAGAQTWSDQNISTFAEYLINKGLRDRDEAERDPALQGLLLLIARLAEHIAGGELTPDKRVRSLIRTEWRNDLFKFRGFKIAVKKLLDTLEEPPEPPPSTEKEHEELTRYLTENYGPEYQKVYVEIHKSPEAFGAWMFGEFWTRFTKSHLPFTEDERSMMSKHPVLGRAMEREYYDFQKARKALELKPLIDRTIETMERDLKSGKKLSPAIEQALKVISEAAGVPPTLEGVKLLMSEKAKDKRR